jgi:L-seryl-tRNA(Ser) seleniumtransferase
MHAPSEKTAEGAALLRQIPSVDELLRRERLAQLAAATGRALVVEAARAVLDRMRVQIAANPAAAAALLEPARLEEEVASELKRSLDFSLRPVINATGVILHTNLGRAPLSPEAIEHLRHIATQYCNLEYSLAEGTRGQRDAHTARLLARLLGAEAAVVVNNNAAAVFLVLSALARGGEVIVSRGELIEIGESFRIPDILAESGAVLREVGTTNRTHIADYERAINERTRLLLRVHPSNFRLVGFTARPERKELVELGRRANLPVCEDLGSGCLADLRESGIEEPLAQASLRAGVDLVTFSGDKLLGGPQAGVIAGKQELVRRLRRHPLFRALRVDKLTIAALEATLSAYLRGRLDEIPALRMIQISLGEMELRAQAFVERLRAMLGDDAVQAEVRSGDSVIGGGSTPGETLPTRLVVVRSSRRPAAELESLLRRPEQPVPVIARVEGDRLVLDLRTVFPEQEPALAEALAAALR